MKKTINKILVNKNFSIKETMKIIDKVGLGIAFIVNKDKKLFGVVTDGDIRRAILKGIDIEKPVEIITNQQPVVINAEFKDRELREPKIHQEIKKRMPLGGIIKIPVINKFGRVSDLVFIHLDERGISRPLKFKLQPAQTSLKKILVTGGAGYLGSILCRKLLKRGYRVRVLDNLTYGDEGIKELYQNQKFEFLKGDIRSIPDIIEALRGVDAVIHLAAIVGDPACTLDTKETLETNYLATKSIVEACKYFQINRFIFASTCSVYGESLTPEKQLTEESFLNPISLYAKTKIECEKSILGVMDENFSPTILRMATLYGQSPTMRYDLAINLLTAQATIDKKITIFGGNQWRPWLHLEDAAQAFIACLEAPAEKIRGEVFNVLSENYKLIQVGRIITSICPAKMEISKKITDNRNYNVSYNKISKILKYCPKKKLADGVKEMKSAIEKGIIKTYRNPKYRFTLPQI